MGGHANSDPELDLAEFCLDVGDLMESRFEVWMRHADAETHPQRRRMMENVAADAMALANAARADADDLLWEYDDE
jgi:hypothetical protein